MTFTSVNPHDPADVLGEWQPAGPAEAAAAVSRATAAAAGWRQAPGAARAKALSDTATALEQRSAEVTDLVVREVGKPLSEARGEGDHVRLAYDGKDLEIMTTGNFHEHLKELLIHIIKAVASWSGIAHVACGQTTWQSEEEIGRASCRERVSSPV